LAKCFIFIGWDNMVKCILYIYRTQKQLGKMFHFHRIGQHGEVLTLFLETGDFASFFKGWGTTNQNVSIAEHGMGTILLTVSLLIDLVTTWRKASFIHRMEDNIVKCFHCMT
jgi:hypothetical protein